MSTTDTDWRTPPDSIAGDAGQRRGARRTRRSGPRWSGGTGPSRSPGSSAAPPTRARLPRSASMSQLRAAARAMEVAVLGLAAARGTPRGRRARARGAPARAPRARRASDRRWRDGRGVQLRQRSTSSAPVTWPSVRDRTSMSSRRWGVQRRPRARSSSRALAQRPSSGRRGCRLGRVRRAVDGHRAKYTGDGSCIAIVIAMCCNSDRCNDAPEARAHVATRDPPAPSPHRSSTLIVGAPAAPSPRRAVDRPVPAARLAGRAHRRAGQAGCRDHRGAHQLARPQHRRRPHPAARHRARRDQLPHLRAGPVRRAGPRRPPT